MCSAKCEYLRTWYFYTLDDEGRCYEMRRRHRSRLSRGFFLLSVRWIYTSVGSGCDIRESFYSIVPATLSSSGGPYYNARVKNHTHNNKTSITQNIINPLFYLYCFNTHTRLNIIIIVEYFATDREKCIVQPTELQSPDVRHMLMDMQALIAFLSPSDSH